MLRGIGRHRYMIVNLLFIFFNLSLFGQDSTNLVIGGDFDDLEIGVSYESMSEGEINIVFAERYQDVDTCFQFSRGYFEFDSSFSGNALEVSTVTIAQYKGFTSGSIGIICIPLKEPLRKNFVYKVSYYVKASYISFYLTKYIGIKFFDKCILMTAVVYEEFDTSWHVDVGPDTVIGPEKWVKVEGEYCARGGERYVVVSIWVPEDNSKVISLLKRYEQMHHREGKLGYIRQKLLRKRIMKELTVKNPRYKILQRRRFLRCKIPDYLIDFQEETSYYLARKNILYLVDNISVVFTGRMCK